MRALQLARLGLVLVVFSVGGLSACTSTPSDAGLTTSTTGGGGCGNGCPSGDVCQNGACVSTCVVGGGTVCGTACVNIQTDNANCGGCGTACTSGMVCSAGGCAGTCAPGYDLCTTDAGFYCAVLAGDLNNCGTCGNVCLPGNYCSMGMCTPSSNSCPQGLTLCAPDGGAGTCVNLASDNNNCGMCGKPCTAGASCLGSTCQSGPTCPDGLLPCPNPSGGSTCVAYLIDPANCGSCNESCGANGICSMGACSCPGLYTQCGTVSAPSCAALDFDSANCGTCGTSCVKCAGCTLGACIADSFLSASATGLPATDGGGYSGVAIADFNGDGTNDIAVVEGASVLVFFGPDYGTTTSVPVGAGQYGTVILATADFNGDGDADLAVAFTTASYSAQLSVFLGSSSGTFSALGPFGLSPMAYSIPGIATGDFNGDAFQDIAVLDGTDGLTVLYGDGSGNFTAVGGLPGGIPGYVTYSGVASGDINGDGVSDIALIYSSYGGSGSTTYLDALFGSDGGINATNSDQIVTSLTGVMAIGGGTIYAFLTGQMLPYVYNSDAGLLPAGSFSVPGAAFGNVTAAATADMNGDGLIDVLALEYTSTVVWLRNDGGFEQPLSVQSSSGGLAVGTLSGNALPDVVVTNGTYSAAGGAILVNTCQ